MNTRQYLVSELNLHLSLKSALVQNSHVLDNRLTGDNRIVKSNVKLIFSKHYVKLFMKLQCAYNIYMGMGRKAKQTFYGYL